MDNTIILKALYEQRKLIICQNYRLLKSETGFSQSYVYSVANDLFPIFHIEYFPDIEIYNEFYKISESVFQEFIEYIDQFWLKNEKIGFYELENKYGGRQKRSELIDMLRYCYLDNRFSGHEFWDYIMENGPIECHSLTKEFDITFDL